MVLASGQNGVNNNFSELKPASLGGYVYFDANDNGTFDCGEKGIAGVTVTLTGTNDLGQKISVTTTTNCSGEYSFTSLRPGTYAVVEATPSGYVDGKDTAGTLGGTAGTDIIQSIQVSSGENGANYDFGERLPAPTASLSGTVFVDHNNDGVEDGQDAGIGNVKVTLTGTDIYGDTICITTYTNCSGGYSFAGLYAGTYTIAESQPCGYAEGKISAGNVGGTASSSADDIAAIALSQGTVGTGYNFAELLSNGSGGCGGGSSGGCGGKC